MGMLFLGRGSNDDNQNASAPVMDMGASMFRLCLKPSAKGLNFLTAT